MSIFRVLADAPQLDPAIVSPGLGGFLVFFALALVCWLLFRSFSKHLRRVNVRAAAEARAAAQARADMDAAAAADEAIVVAPTGDAPTGDAPNHDTAAGPRS